MTEITKEILDGNPMTEVMANIINARGGGKQAEYFIYRMFGFPVADSSKMAGYRNDKQGYRLEQKYRNEPNFRQKVSEIVNHFPEMYRDMAKLRLPQIAAVEGAALAEYQSDPKLAIDKPQLLKQMKQAGGIDLNETQAQGQNTINVERLQVLVQKDLERDDKQPAITVEDVEPLDTRLRVAEAERRKRQVKFK